MTQVGELASLEARIQRLEDIEAARSIYHVYAETLDDPRPDAVAALFTESGIVHTRVGEVRGRSAIRDFYAQAFAAEPSVKRHFVVNPRVTFVEPGRVRLASYFVYVGRGDSRSVIGWGTYDDLVDVSGEAPRFAEKTIDVHVGTDLAVGWPQDSV